MNKREKMVSIQKSWEYRTKQYHRHRAIKPVEKLKLIHFLAKQVISKPDTDPIYAKKLQEWIDRDNQIISSNKKVLRKYLRYMGM